MSISEISKIEWNMGAVKALAMKADIDFNFVLGQLQAIVEFEIVDRIGKKSKEELVDLFATFVHAHMTGAHLRDEGQPMSWQEVEEACRDIVSLAPVTWPK